MSTTVLDQAMAVASGFDSAPEGLNPFPGLRPFDIWENYLFFGRDQQVDALLRKLSEQHFVAVVGTSGSGKSSLVKAGLLPALYGGFMVSAGSTWRVAVMRPGASPIQNLAEALSSDDVFGQYGGVDVRMRQSILETSSLGLVQAVRQADLPEGENLLIVVDQFEELFRFKENAAIADAANEAAAFVKLLLEAVHQRELSIYVLLTLRSDFLGDCAQFRDLPETINEGHFLIPRLRREQQREAILGPVAVGGGKISPRLVQQLLGDLGDNPDQLPIMQHALLRTWDQWQKDREAGEPIDIRHYEAIGRMSHALSQHADEAYLDLPTDRSRTICEILFKCLTMRGADNRGIRRPTRIREICAVAESRVPGITPEEVIEVVEYFRQPGRSFIMPPHSVALTADTMLDISHESLMRVWDRLVGWVEDDAESSQMFTRLYESSKLHERQEAGLWRDPELQQAMNWRDAHKPNAVWAARIPRLGDGATTAASFATTIGFLEDSIRGRELERLEKRRRQRIVNAAVASFLVLAGVLTAWALSEQSSAKKSAGQAIHQQKIAEEQQRMAQMQKLHADSSALLARLEESKAVHAETEAEQQKRLAEEQRTAALTQKQQADAARAEAERSSQIAREQESQAQHEREVSDSLARIAGNLRMLSLSKALAIKAAHMQASDNDIIGLLALQAYQFNRDGHGQVLDPDVFSALHRANRIMHERDFVLDSGHFSNVRSVGFTPNGTLFSASADGRIVSWANDRSPVLIAKVSSGLRTVAFSQDARWLAVAGSDRSLTVQRLEPSGAPKKYRVPHSHVIQLAFLDTTRLLLLSADGYMDAISLSSGDTIGMYGQIAHYELPVRRVPIKCFDLNVSVGVLGIAYSDGTVEIRRANAPLVSLTLGTVNEVASAITIDDAGNQVAVGTEKGTVAVWDLKKSETPARTNTNRTPIQAVAFSPDGTLISCGNSDGKIRIWNSHKLSELPIALTDNSSWIWSLCFAPNGEHVAVACADHKIHLIDTKPETMVEQLTAEIKRNLTHREWEEYIGAGVPYRRTVSSLSEY